LSPATNVSRPPARPCLAYRRCHRRISGLRCRGPWSLPYRRNRDTRSIQWFPRRGHGRPRWGKESLPSWNLADRAADLPDL